MRPLFLLFALACGTSPAPPAPAPSAARPADALVMVGTVAITEHDVQRAVGGGHSPGELTPERRQAVIDTLVTKELRAQAAARQGLDADPGYLEKIRPFEAELAAARRELLSNAWLEREVEGDIDVSEAEIEAYFQENRARIQTEHHVWQILTRDEAAVRKAHAELASGAPFDEVAAKQLTRVPPGAPPWDLGYLRWSQLPPQWLEPVEALEPGQITDVIPGPGGRFWIVKLIERRTVDVGDHTPHRAVIEGLIRARKSEAIREEKDAALRAAAGLP